MTEKIKIITDSGKQVEAQAHVIISASRSTDILNIGIQFYDYNKTLFY